MALLIFVTLLTYLVFCNDFFLQIKTAPNYDDLSIESWDQIKVTGLLGVKASSSKELDIQARHLYVNSTVSTETYLFNSGVVPMPFVPVPLCSPIALTHSM